jgi:hypothetical protein
MAGHFGADEVEYFMQPVYDNVDKYDICTKEIPLTLYDYDDVLDVIPVTHTLYYEYMMGDNIIDGRDIIDDIEFDNDDYELPKNIHIFVWNIPPLLVNLGLLFGRIKGPKYISMRDIRSAARIMNIAECFERMN